MLTPADAAEMIRDNRICLGLPLDPSWQALESPLSVNDVRQLGRLSLTIDATSWLIAQGVYANRQQARRLSFISWLASSRRIGES